MTREVSAGAHTHGFGHRSPGFPGKLERGARQLVTSLLWGLMCLFSLPAWAISASYYYDELGRLI